MDTSRRMGFGAYFPEGKSQSEAHWWSSSLKRVRWFDYDLLEWGFSPSAVGGEEEKTIRDKLQMWVN